MNYEERIVFFVDLLGFGELVNKSSSTNDENQDVDAQRIIDLFNIISKESIVNAMFSDRFLSANDKSLVDTSSDINDVIQKVTSRQSETRKESREKAEALNYAQIQVTRFSDSIVISCVKDIQFKKVVYSLHKLMLESYLKLGVLMRGGVCRGELIHTTDNLFGPAMNKSYKLESKLGFYPRIIMEKSVISSPLNEYSQENPLIYLEESNDGFYEINLKTAFLQRGMVLQDSSKFMEELSKAQEIARISTEDPDKKPFYPKLFWNLNKLKEI